MKRIAFLVVAVATVVGIAAFKAPASGPPMMRPRRPTASLSLPATVTGG
jgi:hypothetical protein